MEEEQGSGGVCAEQTLRQCALVMVDQRHTQEGDLLHPETTISLSVFQITDIEIHLSMISVTIKQIVQDISLCNNRQNGYVLEKFTP